MVLELRTGSSWTELGRYEKDMFNVVGLKILVLWVCCEMVVGMRMLVVVNGLIEFDWMFD